MNRWLTPVLAIVMGFGLADCGDPGGAIDNATCGPTVFNPDTGTFTTVGTSAAALKVNAFLRATLDLNTAVNAIHDDMDRTCRAVLTDLGVTDIPTTSPVPAVNACTRLDTEIRAILRGALPAGARLAVDVQPAVCQVDLNVSATCAAQCTGRAMADVRAQCMGEVVAQCTGSCSGSCSGSCTGGCSGQCTGTCTGGCMGVCRGRCEGTCSAMDAMGNCNGTCSGTCMGTCTANCMGSCSGSCSASCQGSCMGECRGMCTASSSVRCDGRADVQVEAQCDAACEAQANARATCTDPQVNIVITSTVDAAQRARLETLVTSLRRNYPHMLAVAKRVELLVAGDYIGNFTASLNGLPSATVEAGLTAAACVTRAAAVITNAASRLQATATVTVSVSASVSVQGGG